MSVRPYSTESISCTTRSVVFSSDCSTSGLAVPRSTPLRSTSRFRCSQKAACLVFRHGANAKIVLYHTSVSCMSPLQAVMLDACSNTGMQGPRVKCRMSGLRHGLQGLYEHSCWAASAVNDNLTRSPDPAQSRILLLRRGRYVWPQAGLA